MRRKAKIITIAAQKGGASKTTTAAAIAQALASRGKKTLLIDTDSQGSATLIYNADDSKGGSYELITGQTPAGLLIQTTNAGNIIPSSFGLDSLEIELQKKPGRDFLLKNNLEDIRGNYDYIIIDTPPGLGTSLIQALTAADLVIIPLLCDPQALNGLRQVSATIEQVKKYCNNSLKVGAVVITQYQARATLTRQFEDLIKQICKDTGYKLAGVRVRRSIAIQEAQAMRQSLFDYAPKSNPAADYMALCEELKLI